VPRLFIIDGAKALSKAIRRTFLSPFVGLVLGWSLGYLLPSSSL
jgi:hypothetical protein